MTDTIPAYPSIQVQLHADGSAHIDVAGRALDLPAADPDSTRRAVISHAAEVAVLLGRAVRMHADEPGNTYDLAVHPDGQVAEIPPAPRPKQTSSTRPVPQLTNPKQPPAVAPTQTPVPVSPPAPVKRPTLFLRFNTQDPVEVYQNVAIGRKPQPVDGRVTVTVRSPEQLMSPTHALIDINEEGQITVTDHHSGNGTRTRSNPEHDLPAGVPYVIDPGTTLVMGDVECTIGLLGVSTRFRKGMPS